VGIISDGNEHELTQVNLPAGNYVITAKTDVSSFGNNDTVATCFLDGPTGNVDSSDFNGEHNTDMAATIPLEGTVSLSALGSITLSCATGEVGMIATSSKIIAVQVTNLH
jgi:hypothetical protein